MIKANSTVVQVEVRSAGVSDDGWRALVAMLATLKDKEIELMCGDYSPRIKEISNLKALKLKDGLSIRLNKEIPDEVFATRVTTLHWKLAGVSQVSWKIQRMTWLTELNLSYNEITELPDKLWRIRSLRVLNLAYNRVERIPDSFTKFTALVDISLWHNRIADFPWQFVNCRGLKRIDLDGNPFKQHCPEIHAIEPDDMNTYYLARAQQHRQ